MRLSKYTADIELDEKRNMLYNTLSRQYYVYHIEEQEHVQSFLRNLNKGVYEEWELSLFKELLNKKIIIRDDANELEEIRYMENSARYQDNVYKVIVYMTNACNFRCTYCTQGHEIKQLNDDVEAKIIKLIAKQAKASRKIDLSLFGGEPLIEYERICTMLENVKGLCDNEHCELVVSAATNGYLLTLERVQMLKRLGLKWLQITLDGSKEIHDKRRVLANGNPTFDIVIENIIMVLKEGIQVTLRINVDEENISDISEVIERIPEEYRGFIQVSICNLFQNEEELSTFDLTKQTIEKGYFYARRRNTYAGCHASQKNATVINTDGSILLCSNTDSEEKRMGYINDSGNICIERIADYYHLKTLTALDNPECRECVELPFCAAGCKYARFRDNMKCVEKNGDGLSLRERALLDYYYDLQRENKK